MGLRGVQRRWLAIARGILSRPTVSCLEQAPADYVRAFARRRGLGLAEGRYGNLLVKWPRRARAGPPPVVLVAHLDHPGFAVEAVEGPLVHLSFRGGVRLAHVHPGAALEFFRRGALRASGRGRIVRASRRGARRRGMLGSAVARCTSGRAVVGGFAMWAFPGFALRRGTIVSRCLDDLLGVAAALAALDEIRRRRPRGARVWGFFTRAEEVGLLGALAGIRAGSIPKKARVISLEASRALPHAPPGAGVIVRVGDARSVFDARLTGALHRIAKDLASEDPTFAFQRRLMDGGSCEATAFCAAGYRSAALAVPLGNYHNMKGLDGGRKEIGPERVRVSDFLSEVRLLVRLAERSRDLPAMEEDTREWVGSAAREAVEVLGRAPLLQGSAPRPGGPVR